MNVRNEVAEVTLPNGYMISDDRSRLNMEFVHTSLATVNWAAGQPRVLIDRSWSNCLCFGIYSPDGGQVGFGRVLTDYAFRAHLADIFIQSALRGLGLGKSLVETILAHPNLATITQWTLTTDDAQGLYVRYGFHLGEADGKWMVLKRTPFKKMRWNTNQEFCATRDMCGRRKRSRFGQL